jgi:hypothetical protein
MSEAKFVKSDRPSMSPPAEAVTVSVMTSPAENPVPLKPPDSTPPVNEPFNAAHPGDVAASASLLAPNKNAEAQIAKKARVKNAGLCAPRNVGSCKMCPPETSHPFSATLPPATCASHT